MEQNYDINIKVQTEGSKETARELDNVAKSAEKVEKASKDASSKGLKEFGKSAKELGDSLKNFSSGSLSETLSSFTNVANAARGVTAGFGGLAAGAVGVSAAIATAFVAVESFGSAMSAAADAADEMADKLGITTQKLEALKVVADENGGSVEGLQRIYDNLSKSLTRLDEDNEKTQLAFEKLGISAEEAGKLTEQELAGRIIKAYEDLGRSTQATAAVQQLLGNSFREQIPAIKASAESFDEYLERVREFGAVASPALVKAGGEQEKALSNLSLAWKGFANEIAEWSTGALTSIFNFVAGALNSVRKALKEIRDTNAVVQSLKQQAIGNPATDFRRVEASQYGEAVAAANENARIGALQAQEAARAARAERERKQKERDKSKSSASEQIADTSMFTEVGPRRAGSMFRQEQRAAQIAVDLELAAKRSLEVQAAYDEAEQAAEALYQSNMKVAQSFIEMGDPSIAFTKQMQEIARLAEMFPEKADALAKAAVKISQSYYDSLKTGTDVAAKATEFVAGQIANNIGQAFVTGELNFKGFLATVLRGLAQLIFQLTIVEPLMEKIRGAFKSNGDGLSGLFTNVASFFGFADGAAFNRGQVVPFANGGVFSTPTFFPMRNGKTGVMGEAGPEAIMPLTRAADGKLGVRATGGGGGFSIGSIVVNVQGGMTNEQTGQVVSTAIVNTMRQVADQRIRAALGNGGILNRL